MPGPLFLSNSSPFVDDAPTTREASLRPGTDGAAALFDPLESLVGRSSNLARWRTMQIASQLFPSFVLIGPRGASVPIRLAVVGGLRPDELVGSTAVAKLLLELDLAPLLAQDFALFGYPVANPPRDDGTEPDFELDFWHEVDDPVVRFFERELAGNELDGIIGVYGNESVAGFQVQVSSRVIATEVLWPAVEFAQRLVPLAAEPIRYFPRLSQGKGAFHDLSHVRPRPFCLTIHTPRRVPFENQVSAIAFSIKQILHRYRSLVGHAESL
jgi:hypothetical protein